MHGTISPWNVLNPQEVKWHAVCSCYAILTVASFKSTGGCVEGELSVSGTSVGAVKHGPVISKIKKQQESSMTCISPTSVYMNCSGLAKHIGMEVGLMRKPFKWLLWLTPPANPRVTSGSVMELGRGLQRGKDSERNKINKWLLNIFIRWHFCSSNDWNRLNI